MSILKYFSCIVLLTLTSRIYSQIPDTVWTKTFGGSLADLGNSVKQTNDAGFIVAGTTSSFGAGGQDIYLIKTDAKGDTLWTKTFGGTGNDRAAKIVQTIDNGYAIFGTTNSYGNGGDDFLLLKTDSLGNTEWFKTYGGSVNERAYEGHQLMDETFIIAGDSVGQNTYAWLVKTDVDGNFIWGMTIKSSTSGRHYHGRSVQQTDDGGYAFCGIYAYPFYPPSFINEHFLSKISSNGHFIFTRYYGEYIAALGPVVKKLFDGNLILGGTVRQPFTVEEPKIYKTDQNGNVIWEKIVLGSQSPAVLTSIEPTNDNGFIFTAGQNISLLKCDENGFLTWEKIVGGQQDDEANSISLTNDSGYIVTGYTKSFGAGDYDVWLLKFKFNPPDVQIQFFPPVDTALVQGGCTTPEFTCKNLVSTNYKDSISIEPGFNTYFYYFDSTGTQIPLDNYYFIVIDSLYQYDYELWYHPKSFPPFEPLQIDIDSTFYSNQNEFDIQLIVKKDGLRIDSLSQPFHADFGLGVEDNGEVPKTFSLSQNYPNPFNPVTKIKFTIPSVTLRQAQSDIKVTLKVYDVLGNEIATLVNEEKHPGTYEVEFNIYSDEGRNLSSGVYFFQLQTGNYIKTKKMVLMK